MIPLFEDKHSSSASLLSLDKMMILFEDIYSSIINILSLDK